MASLHRLVEEQRETIQTLHQLVHEHQETIQTLQQSIDKMGQQLKQKDEHIEQLEAAIRSLSLTLSQKAKLPQPYKLQAIKHELEM